MCVTVAKEDKEKHLQMLHSLLLSIASSILLLNLPKFKIFKIFEIQKMIKSILLFE
jgi:hypothetical protein